MVCKCKNCELRVVGCHSTCKDYAEFTKANEIIKANRRLDDAETHLIENNTKIQSYLRRRKRRYGFSEK